MQKPKGKSAIMDRVSIYTQLFLLNFIDITTLGGSLMTKDTSSSLSSVSMLLTFLSLLLSQLNYNIFTKIPVAVCAGPILEASTLITKLCTSISKNVNKEGLIINCVVALCICTLIYGIISIIISIFDVTDYLFLIPHSVIVGILSAVGIMLINLSYQLLEVKEIGKEKLGIFYFIFLVIVALMIVFLEKRYNFNYLPPFFLLIITIGLFVSKKIFNLNEDFLLKYTIISSKVSLDEGLKTLRSNFDFKLLKFKVIFKEYSNIIALSFFYLLHLPINLSSYAKVTKVKFNLKKEFRAQGLSNILGSVFVLPVYFICCYSIMLAESGCSSFLDGILLVLIYSFNYFLAGTVRSCVPVLGLALFPVLIGYSFCINGFTAILDGSLIEFSVIWVIAIIGGFEILAMYNLFVLGIIFSFIYYFVSDWYYKKCKEAYNSRFMEEFSQNFDYLKVNYLLYFKNVGKFKRDAAKLINNTIIIDLIGCGAFDMLGNEVFRDNIKEDRTYFVIGSPANFNLGPISGLKNVYLCNDYLHASEKISEVTQK